MIYQKNLLKSNTFELRDLTKIATTNFRKKISEKEGNAKKIFLVIYKAFKHFWAQVYACRSLKPNF